MAKEIRARVGAVTVEADKREIRLYSEQGVAVSLLRAAGGAHASIDGSGGLISTNSTAVVQFSDIDRRKAPRAEIPSHCGRGHPLTADNLRLDQKEQRWRCLQCGRERATAFRRRHARAA